MESEVAQLPLTDRLQAWFETNRKPALWGVAIAAAVGLIAWFLIWHHAAREDSAGDVLSNVAAEQFTSAAHGDLANAYLKVARDYPGSAAAVRASLMGATAFFAEGKYTEAQAQFERFLREPHDAQLTGEALFGIAACLAAQGKSTEAVTAYKDLIERHPNDSFIPEAKFALATLYEGQNKPEQARTLLEDTVRADPYGYLGNEAGMRLKEFEAKYPSLPPSGPINPQIKFEKK